MKAFVDSDICMGCGICESICPKVFQMGAEPYAKVIVDVIPASEVASAREAMDSCPEQAISIKD